VVREADPLESEGNGDPLRHLGRYVAEIRAYALHYLEARVDGVKLAVRRAVLLAVLACVGLFVLLTLLIVAPVLLVSGLAGLIAAALGTGNWVGQLLAGGLLLVAAAATGFVALATAKRTALRHLREKYALRHELQRESLGKSIVERAAGGSVKSDHDDSHQPGGQRG
jgi:hypothetical protein